MSTFNMPTKTSFTLEGGELTDYGKHLLENMQCSHSFIRLDAIAGLGFGRPIAVIGGKPYAMTRLQVDTSEPLISFNEDGSFETTMMPLRYFILSRGHKIEVMDTPPRMETRKSGRKVFYYEPVTEERRVRIVLACL